MKAKLLFTALAALALTTVVTAKDKMPKEKDMAGYVMVYHKDADHGLHMAYSYDGKDCPLKRSNFSEQKHGAVVQVTKKELEKLIKHWEGK